MIKAIFIKRTLCYSKVQMSYLTDSQDDRDVPGFIPEMLDNGCQCLQEKSHLVSLSR